MPKRFAASFISGLFCTASALAQPSQDLITVQQAHALVDREIALVSKDYVFKDKRAAIVAAIRANEAAGKYDLTNPAALADTLATDVIGVSHDKHMWIQYDPRQFHALQDAPGPGPGPQPTPVPGPTPRIVRVPRSGPMPAAGPASAGPQDVDETEARTNNGYEELRVLPGNIRYANLTNFLWEGKTPQAVTDAARFLGGGDAVIIDLRQNGGGSPEAVRAMISYFMPPDHHLLMSYHDGVTGKTGTSRVTDKLDAPRMVGKPLYVLISGNTGSAAEEFAYHIKNFKLGTLVGETTGGAANNDTMYPVAPGFVVSISTGRAIHPVTGTNWEGVGVPPDVSVPAGKALEQAQLLALQKLAATPGPYAQDYAWAIAGENAKLSPVAQPDAMALAEYAGTYGDRTVRIENGALLFARQGRPPRAMNLMSPDLFALDAGDQFRVHFQRTNGKITGFDLMTSDGRTISVARSS